MAEAYPRGSWVTGDRGLYHQRRAQPLALGIGVVRSEPRLAPLSALRRLHARWSAPARVSSSKWLVRWPRTAALNRFHEPEAEPSRAVGESEQCAHIMTMSRKTPVGPMKSAPAAVSTSHLKLADLEVLVGHSTVRDACIKHRHARAVAQQRCDGARGQAARNGERGPLTTNLWAASGQSGGQLGKILALGASERQYWVQKSGGAWRIRTADPLPAREMADLPWRAPELLPYLQRTRSVPQRASVCASSRPVWWSNWWSRVCLKNIQSRPLSAPSGPCPTVRMGCHRNATEITPQLAVRQDWYTASFRVARTSPAIYPTRPAPLDAWQRWNS